MVKKREITVSHAREICESYKADTGRNPGRSDFARTCSEYGCDYDDAIDAYDAYMETVASAQPTERL